VSNASDDLPDPDDQLALGHLQVVDVQVVLTGAPDHDEVRLVPDAAVGAEHRIGLVRTARSTHGGAV
jgi:hypothetical protein